MSKFLPSLRLSARGFFMALALIVIATINAAAAQVIVSPANQQGWTDQTASCGGANTSTASYVSGPASAPLGAGSLRLQVGSNGNAYFIKRNSAFDGTLLTNITALSYSTYVTTYIDSQAIALNLMVDTDNNGFSDVTLWFEPYYSGPGYFNTHPALALGTWQSWNAMNGGWYASNGAGGSGPGSNVKSLATIIAALPPGSKIAPTSGIGGGVRLYSGCGAGSWDNFDGNADNLTIGVSGNDTTYNFDPAWSIQTYLRMGSTVTNFTTRSLRGLALSQDNNFVYPGFIQGGSTGAVWRLSSAIIPGETGYAEVGGNPAPIQGSITGMTSKARAIATDDRGYVYMVRSSNAANVRFEIYSADLSTMLGSYELAGVTPATEMNGISVQNIGGTYYVYVTRGSAATIHRHIATNPASPTLDTSWATGGVRSLKNLFSANLESLNGLEVDTDGTIYAAGGITVNGRDSIFKISPDGSTVSQASVAGAMDVALHGGKVYTSQYLSTNSAIDVRNMSDLSFVATLNTGIPHTNASTDSGYSAIDITDDSRIYVADQLPVVNTGAVIPEYILVSVPMDSFAPSVTINQASGQNDPTSDTPINFTVNFNEPVTGFDGSDVVLGGTAGATTAVVTGGPSVYNVAVSGMTASGTVVASIPAGAAQDGLGNDNDASTSTDNTVTFSLLPCIVVSTLPNFDSLTGVNVNIPVSIQTDMTGRDISSIQFWFTYDPAVLDPTPANISVALASPLGDDASMSVNKVTPGVVKISILSVPSFTGSGTLVNIGMKTIGPIGSSSLLDVPGGNLFIYTSDSVVCESVTPGTVTIISGTITGTVKYKMNIADPAGYFEQPVGNVTITASGPTPPAPAVTDPNAGPGQGTYSMSGFAAGSYTILPTKPNKLGPGILVPNGITADDASMIQENVVGNNTFHADQIRSAQVSGLPPVVNSQDAAMIARYMVGAPNIGAVGQWRFLPSGPVAINTIAGGTYDFDAYLMGDVSGDWLPGPPEVLRQGSSMERAPSGPMPGTSSMSDVTASLPSISGAQNSPVNIPLSINNLEGEGVRSFQFAVEYDPTVLEPAAIAADLTNTLASDLLVVSNSVTPGQLLVAVYGATRAYGDGVFANLRFNVIGSVGGSTPLTIRAFQYNQGRTAVTAVNGTLLVTESQGTTIAGRLLTSNGTGVANTRVLLTASTGDKRTALTNSLGFFEFGGLTVGEAYTISAQAKRHRFTPQVVTGTEGRTTVDIIALD